MSRKSAVEDREQQKVRHKEHRFKRFRVRQKNWNRPKAWEHDCNKTITGHHLRKHKRLEERELEQMMQPTTPFNMHGPDVDFVDNPKLVRASSRNMRVIDLTSDRPGDDHALVQLGDEDDQEIFKTSYHDADPYDEKVLQYLEPVLV